MSNSNQLSLDIETYPTKELFIAMLTRDVHLTPAIIDLADNCTDGARRVSPDGDWKGFAVSIDVSNDSFRISDNCGGISVKAARDYAFRFGRPEGTAGLDGAVGRFGVGMKRGLFKLGRAFVIESTTADSKFKVAVDVDKWARDPKWPFQFTPPLIEGHHFAKGERGTTITVTRLHPNVADQFQSAAFVEKLRAELTAKLEESIKKGMSIKVNRATLKPHVRQFVSQELLRPARRNFELPGPNGKGKVYVELWCGIGKAASASDARREAGWYVFCNDRMLLEADKTPATGWGETESGSMPSFHPQFNDFRGFAYLEADDAADLPWNTTKTALDIDHAIYRRVRQDMVALARPVINFFNKLKSEQDARSEVDDMSDGPLGLLLKKARMQPLERVQTRKVFVVPQLADKKLKQSGTKMQKISFSRPSDKAEEVMSTLKVNTWRKVGEELFDYYYSAECGDE